MRVDKMNLLAAMLLFQFFYASQKSIIYFSGQMKRRKSQRLKKRDLKGETTHSF